MGDVDLTFDAMDAKSFDELTSNKGDSFRRKSTMPSTKKVRDASFLLLVPSRARRICVMKHVEWHSFCCRDLIELPDSTTLFVSLLKAVATWTDSAHTGAQSGCPYDLALDIVVAERHAARVSAFDLIYRALLFVLKLGTEQTTKYTISCFLTSHAWLRSALFLVIVVSLLCTSLGYEPERKQQASGMPRVVC